MEIDRPLSAGGRQPEVPGLPSPDESNRRSSWSGKALFAVVVWGASFVATRIALETFTPAGLVAARFVSASLLLAAIARWTGRKILRVPGDSLACAALGALLGFHLYIQAVGLRFTSAISAGWIIAFSPVPIAIAGLFFLRQRLAWTGWLGIGVATAGILSIVLSATPGFAEARTGDALQLASCLTWTIYTIASAGIVSRNGALGVSASTMGSAAVLLTLAAMVSGQAGLPSDGSSEEIVSSVRSGFLIGPVTAGSLVALAYLGVVCGALAFWCWYSAVNEHGAARAGAYLYIEPFVTVVASAALLQEPITAPVVAGGILVLAGVWLVAYRTRAERSESAIVPVPAEPG
jgi:drug/metabolite transporter (DMT)-like permease